jgi:hypothetical protein
LDAAHPVARRLGAGGVLVNALHQGVDLGGREQAGPVGGIGRGLIRADVDDSDSVVGI